jgi:two-component system chemotaxis response regulator CheY
VTKILVVDDSQAMREQVAGTLAAAGYEILQAEDGVAALDVIKAHPDIALMILDVNMPRMGGLGVLETIRSKGMPPIQAVMLTTEAQAAIIERGKRAGAKGWLVKPFKKDHLIAVAARLTAGPPAR